MQLVILGASRGPGRLLYDQLVADGSSVLGVARHRCKAVTGGKGHFLEADVEHEDISHLLTRETTLVHCGPPQLLTGILKRNPEVNRLVALGSTRLFTRFPDKKQRRVATMTNTIERSGIPATIIHPTLIYGAPGLNNIERIIRFARFSPFLPLPAAGRSLIQPVFAPDVVRAIRQCLQLESTIGKSYILPGPAPASYREFVEACVKVAGLKTRVVSLPYPLMQLLAPFTKVLPGLPTVTADEIERLQEDKNFSADEVQQALGITLTSMSDGLRAALSPQTQI